MSELERRSGKLYALLAYGAWGVLPIYWKQFGAALPLEILSHRMIWSLLLLLGLLVARDRWDELAKALRQWRIVVLLMVSALLLAINWGLYIYGVNSDRVLEASLGYFINPLVTVLLSVIFFRERFSRTQTLAIGMAALGVGIFALGLGRVPWISLGLAFSFAFYGLLRKKIAIAPLTGLAVETLLLTPVALVYAASVQMSGTGSFTQSPGLTMLFIGSGLVTALPLLWFNKAAKGLRFSTLGLFQYCAPSLQLLLGVFLYQEPFTPTHFVTFGLIWAALLLYSASALGAQGRR